ncbi:hypothetical protein STM14_5083 [Salmonella enterica subsp. enterica serovar Typhimurium str. 14028S]|uniref:Uncharacterized protein n=1 Tax=Salmonella typhimurium (strain 14028s / SGSC 2262) TaxID=588858 RepID=A0A0F6BA70_SALT1|nr:hypothetical protein STM14_5083 [Salmonella enterica subsp. enterica serovar Typhimurium str. 14028S]
MPDGGINALSGLQHTVGLISAAPSGTSPARKFQRCRGKPPWMSLKRNTGGKATSLNGQ